MASPTTRASFADADQETQIELMLRYLSLKPDIRVDLDEMTRVNLKFIRITSGKSQLY